MNVDNIQERNEELRLERMKKTGEVFTPNFLITQMLKKLPEEVWEEGKTFCDPACGSGNMLVVVLLQKLLLGHPSLDALKTVFGADIDQGNIREARLKLLKSVGLFGTITDEHIYAVHRNVIHLNSSHKNGTLGYDMSFRNRPNIETREKWMEGIKKGWLAEIDLPVDPEPFIRGHRGSGGKLTRFIEDYE